MNQRSERDEADVDRLHMSFYTYCIRSPRLIIQSSHVLARGHRGSSVRGARVQAAPSDPQHSGLSPAAAQTRLASLPEKPRGDLEKYMPNMLTVTRTPPTAAVTQQQGLTRAAAVGRQSDSVFLPVTGFGNSTLAVKVMPCSGSYQDFLLSSSQRFGSLNVAAILTPCQMRKWKRASKELVNLLCTADPKTSMKITLPVLFLEVNNAISFHFVSQISLCSPFKPLATRCREESLPGCGGPHTHLLVQRSPELPSVGTAFVLFGAFPSALCPSALFSSDQGHMTSSCTLLVTHWASGALSQLREESCHPNVCRLVLLACPSTLSGLAPPGPVVLSFSLPSA
ncbi:uncharacterized protein LOC104859304 [Fukomys damarensis]|uniref:uncharacterized protein LOC104859304 n=1 Tax=Fukomys damarensis TaxID=885580 RepID=UPI0008FEB933|nr:uncharacterized protein LOC104859304 [Fukomys damarensis]